MGYAWGLAVRDATTQTFAGGGQLQVRNTNWQATLLPGTSSSIHEHSTWNGIEAWYGTAGFNNVNNPAVVRQPNTIKLNNMNNLNAPDPRPQTTSELVGTADFSNGNLAGFAVTSYRGAFPPVSVASLNTMWTAFWTNWDPQNVDYSNGVPGPVTAVGGPSINSMLGQNYPNPFNPQTSIDYTIGKEGRVTLDIFDASGAKVKTLVSDVKKAGSYTASFNATGMASGVYFYRLIAPGINEYKKMVLLK
jgi:hypothetical protein